MIDITAITTVALAIILLWICYLFIPNCTIILVFSCAIIFIQFILYSFMNQTNPLLTFAFIGIHFMDNNSIVYSTILTFLFIGVHFTDNNCIVYINTFNTNIVIEINIISSNKQYVLVDLLNMLSLPETIWMIISISLIFIATQYLKYYCCIIFNYTTFLYVFIVITNCYIFGIVSRFVFITLLHRMKICSYICGNKNQKQSETINWCEFQHVFLFSHQWNVLKAISFFMIILIICCCIGTPTGICDNFKIDTNCSSNNSTSVAS
eukprot:317359_1